MNNPFSTHLNTLEYLISQYNVQSVFEFGCGLYSTKLFVKKCKIVYSCEMQSQEWYEKIKNQFISNDNLTIKYFNESDNPSLDASFLAIDYLKSLSQKFDLIFVDGHKDSRWLSINTAQYYSNLIVTHDTEDTNNYHWNRVSLNRDWIKNDIKNVHPWTTYWIKK